MNEIVKKNLEKMIGTERGYMHYLLFGESIGGNAGSWKKYSCAGANFYYDNKTGEIMYFGNHQNVPIDIRDSFSKSIFRVAVKFVNPEERKIQYRIIDDFLPSDLPKLTKKNLDETVKKYNEIHGFILAD